ncbi:competence protein CoiA family protein [Escherichia coli]
MLAGQFYRKTRGDPAGEQWIADVFCTRNNAKLVFEVQLSPQKDDEFKERQKRYIASGVRALWLRKLRKGSKEHGGNIYHSYDLPVFGVRQNENGTCIYHSLGLVSGSLSRCFCQKAIMVPKGWGCADCKNRIASYKMLEM